MYLNAHSFAKRYNLCYNVINIYDTGDGMAKKEKKTVQKRKWWFQLLKKMMKGRYKRPTFVYLGEKFGNGGLILSNHEGTDAPLSLEMYCDKPLRIWGTHEMNSGVVQMYKYQTKVYYHEKKGWNLHLARLFCLLASPLTNLFYKGLNLISTYRDGRFMTTIRQSVEALKTGRTSLFSLRIRRTDTWRNWKAFNWDLRRLPKCARRRAWTLKST